MSRFNNFSLTVMGAAVAVFTFANSALPQSSNTIDEFKERGWRAYSETGQKYYPKKQYQFRIQKTEFLNAPNRGMLENLLGPSSQPFQRLIDDDPNNDDLESIYVTKDNYLTLGVLTTSERGFLIRPGVRKYLLLKQVDRFIADQFRRASPYYQRSRFRRFVR